MHAQPQTVITPFMAIGGVIGWKQKWSIVSQNSVFFSQPGLILDKKFMTCGTREMIERYATYTVDWEMHGILVFLIATLLSQHTIRMVESHPLI